MSCEEAYGIYNDQKVRILNRDGNWIEIENHRGDREMVLDQEIDEVAE
jgi:hypothetical protein